MKKIEAKEINFYSHYLVCIVLSGLLLSTGSVLAQSDLFMRDTLTDNGAEPYAGTGPIYLSPDIWVRNEPDPNYDPRPFSTTSPNWTPSAHQNPEYRDSKTSRPNYVYVRVHNRGRSPSTGDERLRLYQAKASTGLDWPSNWVDNEGMICGADYLLGIEITKPRRNAKSVSVNERNAYRNAVVAIGSDPDYQYSDMMQYFQKQNDVHLSPNPEHGNPAFLPWHRELMNRYEERLREVNPLVTLLYWDFTQSPTSGTNLFTDSFMGASTGTVANPLVLLRPPTLTRNVGGSISGFCGQALFESDATFNAMGAYSTVSDSIEGAPNHDCAHGFIGGYSAVGSGQISSLATAAQDPFFFMLHANVDRQWANWQRENANPDRLDPVTVYGSNSSHTRINANMRPWDGSGVPPWDSAATIKNAKDRSIVYPPIYDTAPLRIPLLQPEESVVIEIPWYPPNVNNYNCSGQAGHFCLLARIETSTTSPFGMTTLEGNSVSANTRNNNNIAWKNVTIVDDVPDPALLRMVTGTLIRNIFEREAIFEVAIIDRTEERRFFLPEFAQVALALPEEILKRVLERDAGLKDLELVEDDKTGRQLFLVVGKEPRFSLLMKPGETFTTELVVNLNDDTIPEALLAEPFYYDIEQRLDLPAKFFPQMGEKAIEVGGVRFTLDFKQLQKNQKEADTESLKLADVQMKTIARERIVLPTVDEDAAPETHFSVGEPVNVMVIQDNGGDTQMQHMSLEIDGDIVARKETAGAMDESIRFDKPGVYSIVVRGIDENGEVIERRTRVLVSENIPPNAVFLSPDSGSKVKLGETIELTAVATPAFEREVREVSLYVKENDSIQTGLNLINSPNYEPIETAEGPGPHTFSFTPNKTGMHMFQLGSIDDNGITVVSGHVMIMVTD